MIQPVANLPQRSPNLPQRSPYNDPACGQPTPACGQPTSAATAPSFLTTFVDQPPTESLMALHSGLRDESKSSREGSLFNPWASNWVCESWVSSAGVNFSKPAVQDVEDLCAVSGGKRDVGSVT